MSNFNSKSYINIYIYIYNSLCIGTVFSFLYAYISILSGSYFLLVYLPTFLVFGIIQYIIKESPLQLKFITHGIVGISWASAFPIINNIGSPSLFPFTSIMSNYFYGLLIYAILIIAQYFYAHYRARSNYKVASVVITLMDLLNLVIPFATLSYYLQYNKPIGVNALIAIFQTNPREALEYIESSFNLPVYMIFLGLIFIIFYRSNQNIFKSVIISSRVKRIYKVLYVFLVILGILFFIKTNIARTTVEVYNNNNDLKKYNFAHEKAVQEIMVDTENSAITKAPGTIILVIGESASRDNMTVYNPLTPYNSTPWLSSMRADENFHIFNNGYSAIPSTIRALEMALTELNQYDNKNDFIHVTNILDVAKKLGYHTYAFSNQIVFGINDLKTTLTLKNADIFEFSNLDYFGKSDTFDEELLSLLKTVNPKQNNFIVLHIMGNHISYDKRYPKEFAKFGDNILQQYYNSTLYTDYVLSQFYTYAKDNLNLQAMIYFSDHGEDMVVHHNPDAFQFNMVRIPFWIYTAPTYKKAFPDTVLNLSKRTENGYFTNDLIYDTVLGILHAGGNKYKPVNDISNPAYKFNEHNLLTNKGEYKIEQDLNLRNNNIDILKEYPQFQ